MPLHKKIRKNNLHFDPSMIFGEDVFFYWTALISSKKTIAVPDCFYHYRRNRPGSQVNCRDKRIFAYFCTMDGIDHFIEQNKLHHLIPWINHLRLSYPAWGFERLQDDLKKEYFQAYHTHLIKSGMTMRSPIAFPPYSGGVIRSMRYLFLRILHPVMLRSILHKNYGLFQFIILLRKNLAMLPFRLKKFQKRLGIFK